MKTRAVSARRVKAAKALILALIVAIAVVMAVLVLHAAGAAVR